MILLVPILVILCLGMLLPPSKLMDPLPVLGLGTLTLSGLWIWTGHSGLAGSLLVLVAGVALGVLSGLRVAIF
jgi:hypothetical protein